MNKKLKKLLASRFVRNSLWLMVLQGFNTVLPMITLPYITRILEPAGYGMFSIALNWVTYIQVIVEYGFSFLGARKAAVCDSDELQNAYNRIMTARILLLCVTFGLLNAIWFAGIISGDFYKCMLYLFAMVVGSAFQLTWLFQGKQEMQLITIVNVISRLTSVVLIFAFVKSEKDVFLYCLLYSCTFILSSILGMLIAKRRYGLRLHLVSLQQAVAALREGWALFLSQAMGKIVGSIGVTVLGFIATNSLVGMYSAIQKIPTAMLLLFSPVSQALYPKSSQDFSVSLEHGLRSIKKVATCILSFFLIVMMLLIVFRELFVQLAFGAAYVEYSDCIIPQCLWLLNGILNNFMGVQILVASGHQKEYGKAMTIAACITVLLTVFMGILWGIYGVAWSTLIAEMILSIFLYRNIRNIFFN